MQRLLNNTRTPKGTRVDLSLTRFDVPDHITVEKYYPLGITGH